MIQISVQPTYSFIQQILFCFDIFYPLIPFPHFFKLGFKLQAQEPIFCRSFKKAHRVPFPSPSIIQSAILRSDGLTSSTCKCLPAWAKELGLWSQLAWVNIKTLAVIPFLRTTFHLLLGISEKSPIP